MDASHYTELALNATTYGTLAYPPTTHVLRNAATTWVKHVGGVENAQIVERLWAARQAFMASVANNVSKILK
jgi:hypothetical protein